MANVWITGGKGFIGRHLARLVAAQKNDVVGLGHGLWARDDYHQWGFKYWLNSDIDFFSLSHLKTQYGLPEVIIHLAGGSAVGPSIENPHEDFQRTVETTARLLDWLRLHSPETRVIGASSAAVYGAGFSSPIRENDKGIPFSPYGFHKAMLETLFTSYRVTYGLNLAVVRLFSVYGAGLEKQLIWDICQKLRKSADNKIQLHGTGQELRDWLHVEDAARLLWLVASMNESVPDIINGGTGRATSIAEVFELVSEAWGQDHQAIFSGLCRKGDPAYLVADSKMLKSIGYSPLFSLEEGIRDVVHWFKSVKV